MTFDIKIPATPAMFEPLSEDELKACITALEEALELTKTELMRKQRHRDAAASLFGRTES